MPFTVNEFRDLIRLLGERPEWRQELRHLLLSDALLAMPEQLATMQLETDRRFQELAAQITALVQEHRQFAQDQRQLAQHVDDLTQQMVVLTQRVDGLTQQMVVLTQRVDGLTQQMVVLTQRVDGLTQQMVVLTQRVDGLTQRVDSLTQRVDDLTQQMVVLTQRVDDLTRQLAILTGQVASMGIDLADVKGDSLERRYRERAPAYFGRFIRRTRALSSEDVAALVDDAVDRGILAEAEAAEITWADLVVRGKRRADGTDVYLVGEVSWSVDRHDVERATLRAALFSRLGLPTQPVVAGKTITDEANHLARASQVWLLIESQPDTP